MGYSAGGPRAAEKKGEHPPQNVGAGEDALRKRHAVMSLTQFDCVEERSKRDDGRDDGWVKSASEEKYELYA